MNNEHKKIDRILNIWEYLKPSHNYQLKAFLSPMNHSIEIYMRKIDYNAEVLQVQSNIINDPALIESYDSIITHTLKDMLNKLGATKDIKKQEFKDEIRKILNE